MREVIKMIFFRSVFLFGLISLIFVIKWYIEEKMRNIQEEIDEIYEKKFKDEKKLLEIRNRFLEEYGREWMLKYYEIVNKYYDLLSFQIYGKSVEEWMKDKDKRLSETIYTKKNKSSGIK